VGVAVGAGVAAGTCARFDFPRLAENDREEEEELREADLALTWPDDITRSFPLRYLGCDDFLIGAVKRADAARFNFGALALLFTR
jgi:hypothetical protein